MTLKFTADQVRDREIAQVAVTGKPNPWWAWAGGSDCMGAQSTMLGIRAHSNDKTPHLISIAAFTAYFGWDKPSIADLLPGDLVCENWTGADNGQAAEHIEYVYSIDRAAGTITTCSANTGPHPGVENPNGFWKKTRPLDGHFLHGVRPPYKDAPDTSPYGAKQPVSIAKKHVKQVAAFVNERAKDLNCRTTTSVNDGVVGPLYWRLVQTWGRQQGIYGPTYVIDGIPGPRSRQVEAVILKRAQAAAKK